MNSTRLVPLLTVAACAGFATAAAAQDKATATTPPPKPPSAGLLNDTLREQSTGWTPWDLGGQVRLRFEHRAGMAVAGTPGAEDFSQRTPDNNLWLLRTKAHLGYAPCGWASAFVEGRDSRDWNDQRRVVYQGKPTSYVPDQDVFDLQQACVRLGDPQQLPLTAKLGRQELSYGDERLVGASDWSNLGRVFDAAKLRLEGQAGWVDGFAGRVVVPRDGEFNTVNDYDWFSGVVASTKTLIPKQETQFYFLMRNVGAPSPAAFDSEAPPLYPLPAARDIYTLGLRVKSLPGRFGGWDYDAEFAGQFGRFLDGGRQLDHQAFAAHLAGGYTCPVSDLSPRLGLEYNFASGDHDRTDGRHGTFENLFPTNHKFYGYMDFVSLQNIHNLRLTTSCKPVKGLTLTLDGHTFWLADTQDYFYTVGGGPRTGSGYGINPALDSYVGSEVDVVAAYAVKRFGTLQAGYGHFFRGDYVTGSLPVVGSQDANWVFAQATFNF